MECIGRLGLTYIYVSTMTYICHVYKLTYIPIYIYILLLCMLNLFSFVQLFATPWTVACRLFCPWHSLGKSTGVGCHVLLQRILLTHNRIRASCGFGIAGRFLAWSHQGSPYKHYCVWSRWLMRTYCLAQGTPLSALRWLKWEGNPEKEGYICPYN